MGNVADWRIGASQAVIWESADSERARDIFRKQGYLERIFKDEKKISATRALKEKQPGLIEKNLED